MSARQVRLVAMREVTARLKSRAYQISSVVLVLLAVGGVLAIQVLPDLFEDEPVRIGLLPATADYEEDLRASAQTLDREIEFATFTDPDAADVALEVGDMDAVLETPERLQFRDEADTTMEAIVRQALFARTLGTRAEALGLSLDEARSLMAPVDLETVSTQPPEEEEEDNEAGQGLGALSAIVLLMAITFYGQWVVVGVIEEKSNRVVEVLLAAVTPGELLVGKVLGILALALIQIVLAAVALVAALVVVEGPDALPVIALAALGMATLWLIIGLLLYNFLYAAVGATASRSEEATSVTVPLMIPLMAGYFVGVIAIPQDPDSLLSRFISIFPLTAPLTMPSRISAGGGSPIEVVIAAVLTLLSLAAVIWIATRIYSGGILQSSKVGLLAAFRRARE